MKLIRTAATTAAVLYLASCSADSRERDALRTEAATIDAETLQSLLQQYPRLGAEPLPEPEPKSLGADASVLATARGEATYYAQSFEGRRTASGVPFRHNQMVAAHRAYPFGTILRVTNMDNDRSVNVRVVDRGPHGTSASARRTVIDLSHRAASELGYVESGRAPVRVEVLEWGSGIPS